MQLKDLAASDPVKYEVVAIEKDVAEIAFLKGFEWVRGKIDFLFRIGKVISLLDYKSSGHWPATGLKKLIVDNPTKTHKYPVYYHDIDGRGNAIEKDNSVPILLGWYDFDELFNKEAGNVTQIMVYWYFFQVGESFVQPDDARLVFQNKNKGTYFEFILPYVPFIAQRALENGKTLKTVYIDGEKTPPRKEPYKVDKDGTLVLDYECSKCLWRSGCFGGVKWRMADYNE